MLTSAKFEISVSPNVKNKSAKKTLDNSSPKIGPSGTLNNLQVNHCLICSQLFFVFCLTGNHLNADKLKP